MTGFLIFMMSSLPLCFIRCQLALDVKEIIRCHLALDMKVRKVDTFNLDDSFTMLDTGFRRYGLTVGNDNNENSLLPHTIILTILILKR